MKSALITICISLFISFLLPSSLSAVDQEQGLVLQPEHQSTPAVAFDARELAALQQCAITDEVIATQVGGADEQFWKAAAIGAGAVILIIIIF